MSSAEERLSVIQANYTSALENEPHDLARATSALEVTAIQTNVAAARETYFTAAAATLTESNALVEQAFEAAKAAQQAVDDARRQSEQIASLITKLGSATKAGVELLNAAKK